MAVSYIRKVFKSYGEFCAQQPFEVIVAALVILVCILTHLVYVLPPPLPPLQTERTFIEGFLIYTVRLLAILHIYYRFKKIHRMGSTIIMQVACSYLTCMSILFAIVIMSVEKTDVVGSIGDSWCLVILLVDMPKVTRMAQFALSSAHSRRIGENLAHAMSVLGPSFTMDSMAKVLLVAIGFLTPIPRLHVFAFHAVTAMIVNLAFYISFYPAVLTLVLELMCHSNDGRPRWDVRQIINTLPKEEGQSPVVHKVRVIATAVLVIVHWLCHRPIVYSLSRTVGADTPLPTAVPQSTEEEAQFINWIWYNFEHVIISLVVFATAFRYLFYEDMDVALELRKTYIEELNKKFEEDSEKEVGEMDRVSNSTDEGISMRVSMKTQAMDDSSSESAWSEVSMSNLSKQERDDRRTPSTESNSSEEEEPETVDIVAPPEGKAMRPLDECIRVSKMPDGPKRLTDDEIVQLVENKIIRGHELEKVVDNHLRGVEVRRKVLSRLTGLSGGAGAMDKLPYKHFDYEKVMGACCENVVGYMPLPVGVVGPLKLDGKLYNIPMATTEGCLVASTNRGCRVLRESGVTSRLIHDGMTRAPVILFPSASQAVDFRDWLDFEDNFRFVKQHFDSTSRFARLQRIKVTIAGKNAFVRFVARTGDAMGMNMLSKATEFALMRVKDVFPEMQLVSLSGNMCTDKKPASINWVDGRGKSVVCEAIVPASSVESVLKTTTAKLVDLHQRKNLIGSAMAGSIGGFNAHSANIVTAIFIATGQDAAQNVGSSNCITLLEPCGQDNRDLHISTTMPSIECGTVGGGTVLPAQSSCLEMLGCKGSHPTSPGKNASHLARIICATVLAGELSLLSALAEQHLVKSHLRHNRSSVAIGQLSSSSTLCAARSSSMLSIVRDALVEDQPLCVEKRRQQFLEQVQRNEQRSKIVIKVGEDEEEEASEESK